MSSVVLALLKGAKTQKGIQNLQFCGTAPNRNWLFMNQDKPFFKFDENLLLKSC